MIKFENVKKCKFCGNEPIQEKDITYGHGESYMQIYFRCPKCRYRTEPAGNYNGYEEVETTYKALQTWNNFQERSAKNEKKTD